ncbi:iron hydrogenase [Clostridium sp. 19966]|uniref:[Fe-Fe] hydrogenase large subunit C-terminal domain-containing protein n=1 Tax=Clostridium sp. 19966 TaxID=2768166 RepID=UPI0028DD6314|nr:[Fe-Fe] hydrogenase large subunit C-terminal domain-containing protein [Clostridium sp. 19966]MDT8715713.1 iron hydrogenase [Clostridium sp. 19966]
MKQEYEKIFKRLVKAYFDDKFETTVEDIINEGVDKTKLAAVVASLCGVDADYNSNYVENLKNAISKYSSSHQIVSKFEDCSDCKGSSDSELTDCQKSCPFYAIIINPDTGMPYIDIERCSQCGMCVDACKNGHITDKVEFIPFANLLKEKVPVIAAVAPAIYGQFGDSVTLNQLRTAFKRIGFTDMVEVAFFADMLTLKEAVEFDHLVKDKNDLMITSCCCPMWVAMLKRVYGDLVKHVSPSVSPMIAAGRVIKQLNPQCKVVFVGPCIAKKAEAKEKDLIGDIDYVLTFEELRLIFEALDIKPEELPETDTSEYASRGGRLYGRVGGVSTSISEAIQELFPDKYETLKTMHVSGVKNCKEVLEKAQKEGINANFLEGMGCVGGCVGGPKAIIPMEKGTDLLNDLCDKSKIKVSSHSERMKDILQRLGIDSVDDIKNKRNLEILERDF